MQIDKEKFSEIYQNTDNIFCLIQSVCFDHLVHVTRFEHEETKQLYFIVEASVMKEFVDQNLFDHGEVIEPTSETTVTQHISFHDSFDTAIKAFNDLNTVLALEFINH